MAVGLDHYEREADRDDGWHEHVVSQIAGLDEKDRATLAMLSLRGVHFTCSKRRFPSGNRWWNVRDAQGKHIGGMGGLRLANVVHRARRHFGEVKWDI